MSRGDFSNSEVYNGGGVDRNGPSHYNEGGSFNLRAAALHDGAQSAQTDLVGKLGEGYQVDIQSIESGKKGTARIVEEHGTSHLVMQEKGSAGEPVRNISIEITNGDIAKALDQVKSALDGSRSSDASSSATETTRPDVAIPGGFKILDVTEFRNAAAQGYKGLSPTDTVPDGIPRPDAAAVSDAQRQSAQQQYDEVCRPAIRKAEEGVQQAQEEVRQAQIALDGAERKLEDINKAYHQIASEKGEEAAKAETEQQGNKTLAEWYSANNALERSKEKLARWENHQNEVAAWAADFREKWGLSDDARPPAAPSEHNDGASEQIPEVVEEPLQERLDTPQEPPQQQPDASRDLPSVRSTSLGPERTISNGALKALEDGRAVEYRGNDGTRIDMQLIRGDEPALLWSASEPGQEENPHQIRTPLVVEGDNYRDADGRDLRAVVENFKAGFYPNYNPSEA